MSLELRPVAKRTGQRVSRLRKLGFASYRDYLSSSVWQRVKQDYRESGRPQCCIYCDEVKVHIHHLSYARVGGDELMTDLVALCASCHTFVHILERRRLIQLSETGSLFDAETAAEYARFREELRWRRAKEDLALREQFRRWPLQRQWAAILALEAIVDAGVFGPQHKELIRQEQRIVRQRLTRAVQRARHSSYPPNNLRVIEMQVDRMVAKLDRAITSGDGALAQLLSMA